MKHNEEPLLDAPTKKSPSKRKDTKKWCRGKVGVEHKVFLNQHDWVRPDTGERVSCRWMPWGRRPHYTCYCRKQCSSCGKVMEGGYLRDKTECPRWEEQPSTEELERRFPSWAERRRR